ncbi:MAG: hypothetical protein CMB80_32545 [Flammeovirgaceae bacterium]|nr:hypothetical protein [Flammeovirgaceae bacterium]|tara:strand:- start:599 stop:1228 length:630 start_codon:yes stop_codon:yes gene_type:complete
MADYPNTASIFDAESGVGSTRTGLSTQIVIYVNNEPVGAIQSFQETQSRTNKPISEVGTDGIIELVPQAPAKFTLQVNRIVFDGLSLPESFSRGFTNIHAQRIPFNIVVIDKFTGTDNDAVVTTYHNCWFNNLSKTYQVSDYTIAETAGIDCEFISSRRANEAVALSQGVGGGRQIDNRQLDDIESAADAGKSGRRGALDFPGLISAAY